MNNFKLTISGNVIFIEDVSDSFIVKVEKNRALTNNDKGAILETFLYKEESTFIENCNYIFEVVDDNHEPRFQFPDINPLYSIVDFFFYSILNTSHFLKRIPVCSSIYKAPATCYENINNIQVSNLYEILSGH